MTHDLSRRSALALAAAAAATPALAQSNPRPSTHALLNQPAPAFDLPKVGGGRARLSDYRGKTLVMEFWGLWCPDCIKDGPHVAALVRAMQADRRLAFLGVHTRGRFGRWGSVETYFQQTGWNFPVALDDDGALYKAYQMRWVPGFLVVDGRGVIRDFSNDLDAGGGAGVAGFLQRVRAVAGRAA